MEDARYCSNCRAELPRDADSCPACGVYAGDLFDERSLRPRTRRGFAVALIVVIALAVATAVWLTLPEPPRLPFQKSEPARVKQTPPDVRVVGDRPGRARRAAGAKINEAEAIRLVRRHLVATTTIANACLVVMSNGPRKSDYYFTAFNRCDSLRMGQFRVDGKTGAVALAK
ncbi:MAG: zinc ribbon domain-containing protein [Acidobacteriota bacterium]|nr:zinc ribbon domain-containing protein [Acidobacteriota bacterium]